jgi:hypothetical protein
MLDQLPKDIIDIIFKRKETSERLDKIEKFARSNHKFFINNLNELFDIIKDDEEDVTPSYVKECTYLIEDGIEHDSKFNFDNVMSYI